MNARRHQPSALAAALFLSAALAPSRSDAQREGYTYLSYVQPDVTLVSKAEEDSAARINMPVVAGDSLVTGVGSRAEAILADGTVVRVDGYTELLFERMTGTYETDDDRDLLYLVRGTAAVELRDASSRESALRLDTDDATILAASRGLFRVDTGRRGTEVYVLAGKVEVAGRGGRALVRAGEYAWVSGDSDVEVEASGQPRDRFARFIEERRDRADHRETTRYVSSDYAYDYDAAAFNDNGSWSYNATYGAYCWRPRVPAGWSPYSLGYWRWTPAGLTWVSYEAWGWLPYHYGTWIFDPVLGWCWLPDTVYSPAWVYWNYTPSWVGWCPIGYYGFFETNFRHARSVVGGANPRIYPHLRGKAAVAQIDPRGWNYVASGRLGVRFDPVRDVLRGDRVGFRPGDIGVIATTPLRIERGSSPILSIQEALRHVPGAEAGGRPAAVSEGLTAVLRRDRTLSPAAQEELRRTVVRVGQDPAYRPIAEARGDRGTGADGWRRRGVDSGPGRGAASFEGPARRESSPPHRERGAPARRGDEGWRSPSSPAPAPIQRRSEDRPARHDDSGWRAPQPRVIERDHAREAPSRDTPSGSSPSAPAPAPQPAPAPPPPAPQAAPAPPPAPAPQAPAPQPARR